MVCVHIHCVYVCAFMGGCSWCVCAFMVCMHIYCVCICVCVHGVCTLWCMCVHGMCTFVVCMCAFMVCAHVFMVCVHVHGVCAFMVCMRSWCVCIHGVCAFMVCAYSWCVCVLMVCVCAHGVCVFMVFVCIYAFCVMLGPLCHGTQAQRCVSPHAHVGSGVGTQAANLHSEFFLLIVPSCCPIKVLLPLFVCLCGCMLCVPQTFMPLTSWRSEDSLHRFCRQVFLWTTSSQMETYIKAWPAAQSCPTSSSD